MIIALDDQDNFTKFPYSATGQLEALPNYQFFKIFSEYVDIIQGKLWTDTILFKHYFNSHETRPFPKFIMYSGHAETLAPLLAGFGKLKYTVVTPPPASALFLEFYREEGQIYVTVYYRLSENEEDSIGTWTIDRFDQFIKQKTDYYNTIGNINGCVVHACQ